MKFKNILFALIISLFFSNGLFAQLYGTYTIGKSGTEDYSSVSAAVNAIINKGISNTVFFKISPGVYEEQLYFPYILGAEVYSPVFFESADGDSSSVLITFKPTVDSIAYTVAFENTRHIVFRNLSLGTDTTSGRIVEFGRGCMNIQLLNCQFIGKVDGNALVSAPCLDGASNQYMMIRNSLFLNGSQGISMCQGGQLPDINTFIENNVFVNQSISGSYLKNHKEAYVKGNTIINTINASGYCGLKFDNCSGSTKILNNNITLSNIGINSFGIRLFKSSGTLGDEVIIGNNFIYQNTYNWCVGINITTSDFTNIYHNSVHLTGYATGSACISYIFGKYSTVKNNIFANSANGYTILQTGAQNMVNDHNNHYFNGSNLGDFDGTLIKDLTELKTVSQQASGSLSVYPQFCTDSNLHTFSDSLNMKGVYISSLNLDIDGDTRNNPPDIGADESTSFFYSIGPDRSACASDSIILDAGVFDAYLWQDFSSDRFYNHKASNNKYEKDTFIIQVSKKGCWFSDTIHTEFLANPEFKLDADTQFCLNKFTNYQISGPTDYPSYLWSDNSQDSIFKLTKPNDTGYVQVYLTVVDSNGCSGSDTSLIHFIQCVGIDEHKSAYISYGPNPSSNTIFISINEAMFLPPYQLLVYNSMGKEVMKNTIKQNNNLIDVSNLPNGIYIFKIYHHQSLLGQFKSIKQ
ncbi:MAG: T9SS type A sorting domain-containing protein [Bacteroidetes bacterium]|nr:T9SS type A sorting domain-containing protein [Bacteroidota bacterium]